MTRGDGMYSAEILNGIPEPFQWISVPPGSLGRFTKRQSDVNRQESEAKVFFTGTICHNSIPVDSKAGSTRCLGRHRVPRQAPITYPSFLGRTIP